MCWSGRSRWRRNWTGSPIHSRIYTSMAPTAMRASMTARAGGFTSVPNKHQHRDREYAMRIYVADDSEDARDIMAAALSSGGYEDVTFAESGLELMARLGIDPPSLSAPE